MNGKCAKTIYADLVRSILIRDQNQEFYISPLNGVFLKELHIVIIHDNRRRQIHHAGFVAGQAEK